MSMKVLGFCNVSGYLNYFSLRDPTGFSRMYFSTLSRSSRKRSRRRCIRDKNLVFRVAACEIVEGFRPDDLQYARMASKRDSIANCFLDTIFQASVN